MRLSSLLTILAFLAVPALRADEVHLKDGTVWRGRVLQEDEQHVVLRAVSGDQMLQKQRVVRVVRSPSVFDELDSRRAKTDSQDPEALWALLKWCETQKLAGVVKELQDEILRLDADFVPVRLARKEIKVGTEWLSEDVARRKLGHVRRNGRWMTSHEAAIYDRELAAARRRQHMQNEADRLVRRMCLADEAGARDAGLQLEKLLRSAGINKVEETMGDLRQRIDRWRTTVQAELRVQSATLRARGEIPLSLGVGSPVRLQIPELSRTSVSTTVSVPVR